ncbi:MAG: hypothetical protein J6T15_03325 [Bacilli bacterium]|nr:hypothetical protein [Bacilli bacterium]
MFFFLGLASVYSESPNAKAILTIMTLLVWTCAIVSAIGIPIGVKGIKNRITRGMSIATTAVSSVSFLAGFIFGLSMLIVIMQVSMYL